MENALSLDGGQTTLIAITVALTVLGLVGLALAMFWPTRWRIKYRLEFIFIIGLLAMAWYADWNSTRTYQPYQGKMSTAEPVSGTQVTQEDTFFDRTLTDTLQLYYAHPGSWPALRFAGPPQPAGFMDYAAAPNER